MMLAVIEAVEPLDMVLADAACELLEAGMPRLALAVERARELVGPREEFGPPSAEPDAVSGAI